ncbi:hypothetical protein EYR40_007301 [Pleurotus pulmonarius]|nr:hypothetical protein EYR40_007301 [Pleurotus pulmonarius]
MDLYHSGKAPSAGGDKLAEPTTVKDLLSSEKQFEKNLEKVEPGFFKHSAAAQHPPFLLYGCSDSRLSEGTLFHTAPGVVFAERNIAAQYYEDDKNGNAVLVYATAHLDVHNIIVMGHYGCGGVAAAVTSAVNSEKDAAKDPIEAWIWPIRDIYLNSKRTEIVALREKNKKLKTVTAPALNDTGYRALVEENVKANVQRIHKSKAAAGASIYGWVYDIATGDIKDLGVTVPFGNLFDSNRVDTSWLVSMDSAEFHAAVYDTVRLIPHGRVTSYGHIAKLIGQPNYSRHVGQALKFLSPNTNPPVPWHRVIASSGTISSRGPGTNGAQLQQEALEAEGVEVTVGRTGELRVDMKTWGWFPAPGSIVIGDSSEPDD